MRSLWWHCTQRRWRKKRRRRPTYQWRGGRSIGTRTCRWIASTRPRSSGCWRNLRSWTRVSPTARTECSCNSQGCAACKCADPQPQSSWWHFHTEFFTTYSRLSLQMQVCELSFCVGIWGQFNLIKQTLWHDWTGKCLKLIQAVVKLQPVKLVFVQETLLQVLWYGSEY